MKASFTSFFLTWKSFVMYLTAVLLFVILNTQTHVRSQCLYIKMYLMTLWWMRDSLLQYGLLFARVVHLFLRLFRTSFILSWIAITLALRIFMYLTMHHCTSANVLTAAALFFMVTSNHVLQHVRYIFTCNMHTFKELMHFVFALYYWHQQFITEATVDNPFNAPLQTNARAQYKNSL